MYTGICLGVYVCLCVCVCVHISSVEQWEEQQILGLR